MILLAEASNEFVGQWVLVAATVVSILVALATIASYFATRGEVTDLKMRMHNLDLLIEKIRSDSSQRGKDLHDRIDPLDSGIARIQGQLEAFNSSFEKFTRIVEATSRARDEQISTFTRALETFATIITKKDLR